jgi:hypothetical protein
MTALNPAWVYPAPVTIGAISGYLTSRGPR